MQSGPTSKVQVFVITSSNSYWFWKFFHCYTRQRVCEIKWWLNVTRECQKICGIMEFLVTVSVCC